LGRRPRNFVTGCGKRGFVRLDRAFEPGGGVVKNVDIGREARALPVDGDAARDVAVGAALCCQAMIVSRAVV